MTIKSEEVKTYFDKVPKEWDALYSHENKLRYTVNRLIRKGLFERHRLTFEHCGDLVGARVLDVGCGTGRFSIECAKRGARRVVGIDFAPSMIEFSQRAAKHMGLSDTCEFIQDDFLAHHFEESFDVILALGLFDYIEEPGQVFEKIGRMAPRRFLASFPRFTLFWGMQRHVRYRWLKKCPIYYYTATKLEQLGHDAGFADFSVIKSKRGFFCVGKSR